VWRYSDALPRGKDGRRFQPSPLRTPVTRPSTIGLITSR